MGRTRRAVAAIAVVATLATGTVASCTGPPPSAEAWEGLWRNIGIILVVNIFTANGWCFLPCLPVPTDPGPVDPGPIEPATP